MSEIRYKIKRYVKDNTFTFGFWKDQSGCSDDTELTSIWIVHTALEKQAREYEVEIKSLRGLIEIQALSIQEVKKEKECIIRRIRMDCNDYLHFHGRRQDGHFCRAVNDAVLDNEDL